MSPRFVPSLAAAALSLVVAGCAGAGTMGATSAVPSASTTPASPVAAATSAPTAAPTSAPTVRPSAAPTASPDSGNVEDPAGPVLSVEPISAVAIRVTLADPAAKAWRVSVSGTGAEARSRWDLTVETGDIAPAITTRETLGGVASEPVEQTALESGSPAGRICSVAVPVCIRAASVVLPADGNGTVVLEITRTDTTAPLEVTGATAAWAGAPFILGPWAATESFPWAR